MLGGGCGRELAHWIIHGRPEKDMYGYDIRYHECTRTVFKGEETAALSVFVALKRNLQLFPLFLIIPVLSTCLQVRKENICVQKSPVVLIWPLLVSEAVSDPSLFFQSCSKVIH